MTWQLCFEPENRLKAQGRLQHVVQDSALQLQQQLCLHHACFCFALNAVAMCCWLLLPAALLLACQVRGW